MKYLILFEKGESARWLGHLDILRTFERAIRRAELPIAFSAGFNPRERIAFASALSVGVTGAREPATLELTAPVSPLEIVRRLNSKLPPGIQLRSAEEIPDAGSRDLLNAYDRAALTVVCDWPDAADEARARAACERLLARVDIPIEREREGKIKRVDIRPLIEGVEAAGVEGGRLTLRMTLRLGHDGTAKPAEIVGALAAELPGLKVRRVHREGLLAAGQANS